MALITDQTARKQTKLQVQVQKIVKQTEESFVQVQNSYKLLVAYDGEWRISRDWVFDFVCMFNICHHCHTCMSYSTISSNTVIMGNVPF